MSEVSIADRIKKAIIDNGGYQHISELTNISKSTLARMAAGQTEPKLKDVMDIAKATRVSLNYIAYGMTTEDEEESYFVEKAFLTTMMQLMMRMEKDIQNLKSASWQEPKGRLGDDKAEQLQKLAQENPSLFEHLSISIKPETPVPETDSELLKLISMFQDAAQKRSRNIDTMIEPTQTKKSK
ncbi:helix-turn-helix transcriptional regulator [Vibrio fluvialis]|nr:helix-turn-helix transcriptional regulator [Vibrio fluvialis]